MSSRYGFLVLLLILITGAALAWSGATGVFASAAGNLRPPTDAAPAHEEAVRGDAVRDDKRAAANERAATASSAAGPRVGPDQVLVRVVDQASGAPVADAEVVADDPKFRFNRLSSKERVEYQRLADHFQRCLRWGQKAVSDAQGYVVLQRKDEAGILGCAQKDGLFGQTQLNGPPPSGGFVIKLAPDQGVDVQVVDAAGKPLAEVPVNFTAEWLQDGAAKGDRNEWPAGCTDADGMVRARHLQLLADDWQRREPRDLRVYVAGLGLGAANAPVKPQSPVGAPVVLRMPPFGMVQVALTDRRDRPLPDALDLSVALSANNLQEAADRPWDATHAGESVIGGAARFQFVGLGLELEANAWLNGNSLQKEFAGPRVPGETVRVALSLAEVKAAHIHGRLVGKDGAPREHVELGLVDGATRDWFAWSSAGADGAFDWLGDAESFARIRSIVLVVRDEQSRPVASSAPLPVPADLEDWALGDVVLQDMKAIASGRVKAWIDPPPKHTLSVAVWQPGDGANTGDWVFSSDYGVDSQADGSFTVQALAGAAVGQMRLSVSCDEAEPVTPFEFALGRKDLLVQLVPGAKVSARVLLDPEVLKGDLALTGKLSGMGTETETWGRAGDQDALLQFGGLKPGSYRLELMLRELPILTLDGLQLTPGGAPDPRLDPIDLRGKVHLVRLRLLGPDHQVLDTTGQVRMRPPQTGTWIDAGWLDHGVATFASVGSAVEVVAASSDFRPAYYQGPPGQVDLRVDLPFAVEIELAGLPELGGKVRMFCSSRPTGGSPFARSHQIEADGWFDQESMEEFELPAAGKTVTVQRMAVEPGRYDVNLLWPVPDQRPEVIHTAHCELSPQQAKVRVQVPAEVAERIRAHFRAK